MQLTEATKRLRETYQLRQQRSNRVIESGPAAWGALTLGSAVCLSPGMSIRARGVVNSAPFAASAAAAAMATSARADAATNGCVCSGPRGTDPTALMHCAGVDCPLGGFLHSSPCASDSERNRYERALDDHESFLCDTCTARFEPEPLSSLILPADTVPMQSIAQADGTVSIAPSEGQSAMSRIREVFGLPPIINSFRWKVTQSYLEDIRAERSRQQRENLRIDAATVPFLESVHAKIQELGGKSRLVIERDSHLAPSFISFSWALREMIEGGLRLHKVSSVVCTDESHQYDKGGCLLGAHVGIVPDAGGAVWPLAWHLVLLPPGSIGLATRHMQESTEFVVSLGYPMPTITFFDKAEAAHNGWLAAVKSALRSAHADGGPLAKAIAQLQLIARDATPSQVLGARLLIRSMPQFCEPADGSEAVPPVQRALPAPHVVADAEPPAVSPDVEQEVPAAAAIESCGEASDARRPRTLYAVASTLIVPGSSQSPLDPSEVAAQILTAGYDPLPLPSDPNVVAAAGAADGFFQPALLADYPAIIPGIASVALSLIFFILPRMLESKNTGSWNELALQFEWLLAMSSVDGGLANALSGVVTVYGMLCIFHVFQALERYAKKRGVVPTPELQRTLIDRFKNVSVR